MPDTKIALITGAGSGIGRATARLFLDSGWTVILAGRTLGTLQETGDGHGDNGVPIACDVGDSAAVDALFAAIEERFRRLDLLFNNAGTNVAAATIDEIPTEGWREVLDVNLTGSFLCARAAFGLMRRQIRQGGRIINNGSISAFAPRPGSVPYTVTKHAITGLTKCLALDGRPFNIACGQIDIGNAASDMTARMADGVPQANGTLAPEPRMDVAHVAQAVLAMASLPLETNVLSMTVMATKMPFVGRG